MVFPCSCYIINLNPPVLRRRNTSGIRNPPLHSWPRIKTFIWNKSILRMMWMKSTSTSTPRGRSFLMNDASLGLSIP
ncbi:hypothetical protein RHMOL_Rhmol02G0192600 [Rhododendron molle]|uniref:Uncharacterized protein n=1 Tax=Rhododendron molle TaxID=49168 RepID=A0ACC0PTA1_RHOML|nr:hypothetical protein RHMOL_Rhmol02G0192600 [Rhododendron molle]